ncbi:hypothetical protein EDE12_12213 [Methylosinus sp. sav-2]|uniref:hypothetical protein n=1 Tax=Methylosinus sp. sav-2 TaxID=2485168 RepID=UPI000A411F47|nr:hypothetical protein [Methylosinus sp. sav-2]TDX60242.1 hypothetical protein EDE12_12213 [Methylosinus sp. sav-2]
MMAKTASLALLLAFTPLAATAATPEEAYISLRDRSTAKLRKLEAAGKAAGAAEAEEQKTLKELGEKMEAIIGPVSVPGFQKLGKYSIETLFDGVGADQLDGLAFSGDDDKSQLTVSTQGLAEAFLRAHRKNWLKGEKPPQSLGEALPSPYFYTLAVSPDAGVEKYADLPIAKPSAATLATALLDLRSQDDAGGALPDEIIVAVASEGRLYIASTPAKAKIESAPACEKIWSEHQAKAKKAMDSYSASGLADEKDFEKYSKLQEEGSSAFRHCFAEHAKSEKFFAALTQEAQALADKLAATKR